MHNKVQLIGRLGKDPVIKDFQDGGKIAEFALATLESYKKGEEIVDITDWHNIKITNRYQAKTAQDFLKKGMLIFVEGKMRMRQYEKVHTNADRAEIKVTHYIYEVIVETFKMLDKKENSGSGSGKQEQHQEESHSNQSNKNHGGGGNSNTPANTTPPDDDLPF